MSEFAPLLLGSRYTDAAGREAISMPSFFPFRFSAFWSVSPLFWWPARSALTKNRRKKLNDDVAVQQVVNWRRK